jgi:AAA+ ATPase superfamily predicted ATPase
MFYGREDLIGRLEELFGKRTASLVTCRGRRRVGKSTLIEKFAERAGARFIKIEGVKPRPKLDNAKELENFAAKLASQTHCESSPPTNWLNAFLRLDSQIRDNGRTVVLLDEISWMAHYDPLFAGMLKSAWDDNFKRHPGLVLVLCGSVSSWIKDNILDDGSFYGRRSLDIVVPELPVSECVKFWGRAVERIDTREIVDVLSVTGGIPRYLEEIDPGLSAAENIRRMAFRGNGLLRTDFDEMFTDVVTRQPRLSAKALRALAGPPMGVSELADALGMERGGKLSAALVELEEAGLVGLDAGKNPETGASVRDRRYRLKDNYARFYLRYIEPVKEAIDAGSYALASLDALDSWESVMGYAFENLVVNNWPELVRPLHLGRALIESAAPWRQSKAKGRLGVQADLLIQTRRALCVVEVKRQREIGREVIDEVAEKVRRIPRREGMSVKTALVYEGHLAPIVEADGYFDAIVPFRQLLGV